MYILIFIFGFVAISLWSFWITISPPKVAINQTPNQFNLPAREVAITTKDGLKLSAWFVPSPETKRALILLHGYPADKGDMLFTASSLYPDFSLLLLDLRYFGKSQGSFTTLGLKERFDVEAALDFLESKKFDRVGVFGFSLGGAAALLSAADDSRIKALATYAAFSDLRTLGLENYSRLPILKYPFVELMLLWGKILFREDIVKLSPLNAATNISVPVLLIHSKEDEQISFGHALRLKKSLDRNPKAEFYFLEKGGHGELPIEFEQRLKDFFEKSL